MANGSDTNSYDVFLSHGSPDKPWVRQLHARLEAAGVTAYLDEVAIEAGDNFVLNLSNGIGGASTFVIVVSQGTTERPWVAHEWSSFMATHGPNTRIIPVLLDHAQLPPFLKPYQAIHAVDRNVDAVAWRIARAVGQGNGTLPDLQAPYTGQNLIFTIASVSDSDQLAVTSSDGTQRTIAAPWRKDNAFDIALMDFEQMTRATALDDDARAQLGHAAKTLGAALFDLLFSDEGLQSTFARATAPGARAVVTVQSDDDMLLSLPWELLLHDSRFLVRDGVLDVVRSTTGPVQFETQLTPPSEPFTVVTHIAAPEGSALSYEAESFRITRALTDHCSQTATELGTLDDLVDTVKRAKPRGIHFSGHGSPGELLFEDDEGFEAPVTIECVVTALRQQGDGALPPFFFLASCHGNTPAKPAEGKSGSASSAAQLHREGVTEVVGYYGPIVDELSTRAEEALYAAIAAGEPTRLAVANARAALQRAFDGDNDSRHGPEGFRDSMPTPAREGRARLHAAPFAWAQLVFYRRGPEHPLGTPASSEKLRQREAALTRTYRDLADRAFLATGFIGRRQELHQLRRRRRRGDRVFVLQGLGGLGKTTLAGHLLPLLADAQHTVTIWCRRSEGESDQAEALVGQLLTYARARFGVGFEQIVSRVDRTAGEDAAQRFAAFFEAILAEQPGVPLVIYFDNLESLLQGPDTVSTNIAPDSDALGAWRSDALQRIWRGVAELAGATDHLSVVATCRYRNDDLLSALQPVSPLADVDLFRLMAWFPALRRLSMRTKTRLAARLSGHPRAVEYLDALIAASIRTWENSNGEWTPPASRDVEACEREWDQLVAPVLPTVQDRIWSDLLLAALWERVLDPPARRMLFRMTLLRRPWDVGLLQHLGEPEDDADAAGRTARTLSTTSLLEQITLTVTTGEKPVRRPFHTVHAATAAFVKSRFVDAGDLVIATHRRVGTYLEEKARTSPDLSIDLEAGYHLFEAGEYDRAYELLGAASDHLRGWGRSREALQILLPFLTESIRSQMARSQVGLLFGTVGLAYEALGESRPALEYHEHALALSREIGNRPAEGYSLGNLGNVYIQLGEPHRAIERHEQALAIAQELGDRRGEGNILGNLGNTYFISGEIRRGIAFYEQQLLIVREIGDRRGEGNALGNLGNSYAVLGETHRAIKQHEEALSISREIGDQRAEGEDLGNLGNSYHALGEIRRALDFHAQRIAIARQIGDRRGEGGGLSNLGNAYAALGEFNRAIGAYEQGLAIGRAISDPRMIRICQTGLEKCAASLSRSQQPQEPGPDAPPEATKDGGSIDGGS